MRVLLSLRDCAGRILCYKVTLKTCGRGSETLSRVLQLVAWESCSYLDTSIA